MIHWSKLCSNLYRSSHQTSSCLKMQITL